MKRTDLLRAVGLGVLLLILLLLFLRNPVPASKQAGSTPGSPAASAAGSSSSVSKTDANGVVWSVERVGGVLVSTEPNAPKPGAPIVVKTSVQPVGERERLIGLLLEGQAGEQYKPAVTRNGMALAAPALRIVDEAGRVLAQGNFQYG